MKAICQHCRLPSCLFLTFVLCVVSVLLAFTSEAQAQTPLPGQGDWHAPLPIQLRKTAPDALADSPAATPPLGAPGLSFRYVQRFGVTGVPYQVDTEHLNYPYGLATDGTSVWIAEALGLRILKFGGNGAFITQIGRAGDPGVPNANIDIDFPADVAVDGAGSIWVVNMGNSIVLKFNSSGRFQMSIGTNWSCGTGNNQFCRPSSIALDTAGNLYVSDGSPEWSADQGNHRIQIFTSAGVYLNTIGVSGIAGSDTSHFHGQRHITIADNHLYVADSGNHRVQVFDVSNPLVPVFLSTIGVSAEAGSDNAHFNSPGGVAIGANSIFVADTHNHRVQVFNRATRQHIATIGGGPGETNDQFNEPGDVAIDGAGNLFVADFRNQRVQQFDANRNYVRTYGVTGVPYLTDGSHYFKPHDIAVAEDGAVYLTEDKGMRLVKLDSAGALQWAIGRAGINGGWNGENDMLNYPSGVALAHDGRVYVADRYNHRIQIFTGNGQYPATIGAGEVGADNMHFNGPTGLDFGPNHHLYVADKDNHRVQIFDANLNYVATIGVTGQSGQDNSHLNGPHDVFVDDTGTIYVADSYNHRVQVFDANRNHLRTLGMTGVSGQNFANFREPGRLAVDQQQRLYVADGWNGRIQVFDASGAYLTTIGGGNSSRPGDVLGAFGVDIDAQGNVYVADYWANHRVQKFSPGIPNWVQRNLNGFGNPATSMVTSLEKFQGFLYAGAAGYDRTGERRLMRSANGADWTEVIGASAGSLYNRQVDDLAVWNGFLYASTGNRNWDQNKSQGGEIWRSSDGLSWTPVATGGFGDAKNVEIFHLRVFSNTMFAFTLNGSSGAEVWRASDGQDWQQVVDQGFGDPTNFTVRATEIFNGYLYAGTDTWDDANDRPAGCEIWRTANGADWTRIVADGFGGPDCYAVQSMAVFRGDLYAGTGIWDHETNAYPGGQIWRCTAISGCDEPGDWQLAMGNGFGSPENLAISGLIVHDRQLFAAAYNFTTGAEVWRTSDGDSWSQVASGGFGDSNNQGSNWDNSLATIDGALYVGTFNSANGGELWQYLVASSSLEIDDPTITHTLVYTPPVGGRIEILAPAHAVTEPMTLALTPLHVAIPPIGLAYANRAFELDAYENETLVQGFTFVLPITITIVYSDADVSQMNEEDLLLMRWNPGAAQWEDAACGPYDRRPAENRLSVAVCHLSEFGLFTQQHVVFLPTVRR